jgi:broad specificity phosphatase PhoE
MKSADPPTGGSAGSCCLRIAPERVHFEAMPVLLLVRHGETAWNRTHRWQGQHDMPLNEVGEAQATATARRLMADDLSAIYSSDLIRARQTAETIASACRLELRLDAGLREVDVGSWVGLTSEEAARAHPEGHARWRAGGTGWDDGETYPEMADRVVSAVTAIAGRYAADDRIVVVTHGGPIRALAAHAVALEGDGRRRLAAGPNASLTTIDVRDEDWRLVAYNDAGHIAQISEPGPDLASETA